MLYDNLIPGDEFSFREEYDDSITYGIKVDDRFWKYNDRIHGEFYHNVFVNADMNWEVTPL